MLLVHGYLGEQRFMFGTLLQLLIASHFRQVGTCLTSRHLTQPSSFQPPPLRKHTSPGVPSYDPDGQVQAGARIVAWPTCHLRSMRWAHVSCAAVLNPNTRSEDRVAHCCCMLGLSWDHLEDVALLCVLAAGPGT
jgi:hypothetical protein